VIALLEFAGIGYHLAVSHIGQAQLEGAEGRFAGLTLSAFAFVVGPPGRDAGHIADLKQSRPATSGPIPYKPVSARRSGWRGHDRLLPAWVESRAGTRPA
jgi:hypothetical protein